MLMFVVIAALDLVNCSSSQTAASDTSGAQLWALNCIRCHNSPPPNAYDDKEWTAIANHMQKVAGLTVSDADKIGEYLKSLN